MLLTGYLEQIKLCIHPAADVKRSAITSEVQPALCVQGMPARGYLRVGLCYAQALASKTAAKKTPSELMSVLDSLCFYRIEEWWTFELCYKKHVRQFHKEHDKVRASSCTPKELLLAQNTVNLLSGSPH